ncbi:hypothetical protein ECC02_009461 [Trypanosoma cruzi]|uniref:Uncharacterized protein n=1 Tax=Trypanosoma cruzi TaxID=5693 RepID=A0A7J6XTV2_TRYCR|nr:hypothetical protein ECC02_009461 [Trypanosoma cruzi]
MTNRVDRSRTPSRTSAGPCRNPAQPGVVGTYRDPPTVARSVAFASSTLECSGIAPCSTIVPSSDVTFVMLTRAWGIRRAVLSLRPPIRSCAPPASTQWRSVTFSASANASIERRSTATVIGPLNTTESKHAVARPPPTVTDSVSVTPLTQPSLHRHHRRRPSQPARRTAGTPRPHRRHGSCTRSRRTTPSAHRSTPAQPHSRRTAPRSRRAGRPGGSRRCSAAPGRRHGCTAPTRRRS